MTTNERGLVIVTGASSRIGEAIALHLGEGGFSVPAGVRRASVSYSFGTPAGEPL
jgi:NADP-dependent 3-hydroxy acid dehydrogenase YdfG